MIFSTSEVSGDRAEIANKLSQGHKVYAIPFDGGIKVTEGYPECNCVLRIIKVYDRNEICFLPYEVLVSKGSENDLFDEIEEEQVIQKYFSKKNF